MIVILFVALAIVYYLVQYMDKRRRDRNEEMQERRKNSYIKLLDALKENPSDKATLNKKDDET